MPDRDRRPGCGDMALALLIAAIVIICMCESCPNEAHGQESTKMEQAVKDILDSPADPVEAQDMEAIEDMEPADEPDEPVAYETGEGSWVWLWLLPIPLVVIAAFLLWRVRPRGKKKRTVTAKATPKCPACDKPYDGQTYALPRLVVPRRTFNLGQIQITWPEHEEEQTVEVCPHCYEVGLMLTRVERERVYETRAKDRTNEMEKLMRFQQSVMERIREVRFPKTNGKD